MKLTIHKFPFGPDGTVVLPANAKVLTVQTKDNSPFLWAVVDRTTPCTENREFKFIVLGTGHDLPDNAGAYIDSFQLNTSLGTLIFHVFNPAQ